MYKFVIEGHPAGKKTSQQIIFCKGKPKIIQNSRYNDYEQEFIIQMYKLYPELKTLNLACPINLKCVYYIKDRRKRDLVNLLQATCDILVNAGVIKDDNHEIIRSFDGSTVYVDKIKPRVEICIDVL